MPSVSENRGAYLLSGLGVVKDNGQILQLFLTYKNKCFYLNTNCKAVNVTFNNLNLILSI